MTPPSPFLVILGQRLWTLEAVHLACSMARHERASVTLVHMMAVMHPGYLGSEFACWDLRAQEQHDLNDYTQLADAYGVNVTAMRFQYIDFTDGVCDAAEQLDARFVFATLPPSRLTAWHDFRTWRLTARLARQGRTLCTLEPAASRSARSGHLLVTSGKS